MIAMNQDRIFTIDFVRSETEIPSVMLALKNPLAR
jgi:hypothetical protein